jgi:hypothetical protein
MYMGLEQYIIAFVDFTNTIVIPFLLGMAFLFLVINVFRFFIIGGANTDSQEKARALALYGVGAFVLIIIFWGIINILTSTLGLMQLGQTTARCFDYDKDCDITPAQQTNNGADVMTALNTGGTLDTSITDNIDVSTGNASPPNSDQLPGSGTTVTQLDTPADGIGTFEYSTFIATEDAIKPIAEDFVRQDAPDLFGRHAGQIVYDLFADLPLETRDNERFSDVDRVQASQRLLLVVDSDEVSNVRAQEYQAQLENYYAEITPGYEQESMAPELNTITKTIPDTVQTDMSITRRLIEDELVAYYSSAGLGLSQQQIAQNVRADLQTVSNGTTQERFTALENLYDQNILRDPDNVIYDRFAEDLNVENIYNGTRPDF